MSMFWWFAAIIAAGAIIYYVLASGQRVTNDGRSSILREGNTDEEFGMDLDNGEALLNGNDEDYENSPNLSERKIDDDTGYENEIEEDDFENVTPSTLHTSDVPTSYYGIKHWDDYLESHKNTKEENRVGKNREHRNKK
ncbi:MAG: hypothetical protein KAX49_09440 [Halanaerobiales bacterium]|nr:hypothetical protein [Halanaerobiales bacterium]